MIVQYCALSESLLAKQQVSSSTNEREERDKQRLKDLENMVCFVFKKNSEEISATLSTAIALLASILKEKKDDEWDGITE